MEQALATSTFLECHEWLRVYVQADLCTDAIKAKLMQKFFYGIDISYELAQGLVIWPQDVIETAQSVRESIGGEDRPKLNDPLRFRSRVQLCASMAADLAFSDEGKAFGSLVYFSKSSYWRDFLNEQPSPEALSLALSGRADPWLDGNRILALAGLVKTVEHTRGLSFLIQELQRRWYDDDWVKFKEGVVAAHGWRLNPKEDAQQRYDQMVDIVDALITAGLNSPDSIPMGMSFKDEADASLAFWRSTTAPSGKAAGSGND